MATQPTNATTNTNKPANLAASLPKDTENTKQIEITGPNAATLIGNTNKNTNKNNTNNNTNNNTKRRNLPNLNNANLTRKRNIANTTTGNTNTNNEAPEGEDPIENESASENINKDSNANNNAEGMANTANEAEEGEGGEEGEEGEEGEGGEEDEDPSLLGNAPGNQIAKGNNAGGNNGKNKAKMVALNNLAMNLFNHQIIMKLFHFQTAQYGAHKASDAYLEKFAATMDKFLEIAQGIYGKITLKKYTLKGTAHTDANITKHIDAIITVMRSKIDDILEEYTDLINIRDEMVGDLEQLKYLLTFK